MKFSIITPTYKRPAELVRSVNSVLERGYQNFEIIIVNDSPDFDYKSFEINKEIQKSIENGKVKYFVNKENMGVNYSRNFALENVSIDSDYIVFLDDDDWLVKDALQDIYNFLSIKKEAIWLITNLSLESGELITKSHISEGYFSYFWDYLIFKKFKGDPTHAIKTSLILNNKNKINFSKSIKNGEEWTFFTQIKTRPYYKNINTKVTKGYELYGLTKTQNTDTFKKIKELFKESVILNEDYKNIIYLFLRTLKLCYNLLYENK